MAFTYDIATDIGKVRRLIGDTTTPGHQFEDAEVQFFLDQNGGTDYYSAAADALDAWAADLAPTAQQFAIGDYSEDNRQRSAAMATMAKQLREKAAQQPADGYAETAWDPFSRTTKLVHDRLSGVS